MLFSHRSVIPFAMLGLAVLTACQDPLNPSTGGSPVAPRPQFAQGDNGTWTVNSLADPGDGTCDDTECTLREAIAAATSGGTIVFDAALDGMIPLTAGQLIIASKDLTVDGDNRITVDAGNASRGFRVDGTTDFHDVTLARMSVQNGSAGGDAGGGILVQSAHLRLEGMTVVSNNTQSAGGGVYVQTNARLTMVNSTVDRNFAEEDGGAIYTKGDLEIQASTLAGNESLQDGGGLYVDDVGTATVKSSTISGNTAGESFRGGGIHSQGATLIRSSTIVGNRLRGTGTFAGGVYAGATVRFANTIVAGNQATTGPNCAQEDNDLLVSLGHNMSETNSTCLFTEQGDIILALGQLYTEVLQDALGDNGGPTMTHALLVRGRAVDAGYCPGETADQRGFARPVDDPVMPNALDACDIGAYELQGPFVARTDLIISQSANKLSVKQGDLLTYTVRVQNLGPETAPNVVVTNVLSSGVTFVSATHAKGTHTAPPAGETGTVTWYLGDMADQANEFTEIVVTVRIRGKTTVTNTASVASDAVDPNPANNSAALTVSVAAGSTKPPAKGK